MSPFDWMRAALETPGIRPVEKLVLVAMASYANGDGDNVWPSKSRLAKEVGVADRSVYRAIAGLLAAKRIESMYAMPSGAQRYRLLLDPPSNRKGMTREQTDEVSPLTGGQPDERAGLTRGQGDETSPPDEVTGVTNGQPDERAPLTRGQPPPDERAPPDETSPCRDVMTPLTRRHDPPDETSPKESKEESKEESTQDGRQQPGGSPLVLVTPPTDPEPPADPIAEVAAFWDLHRLAKVAAGQARKMTRSRPADHDCWKELRTCIEGGLTLSTALLLVDWAFNSGDRHASKFLRCEEDGAARLHSNLTPQSLFRPLKLPQKVESAQTWEDDGKPNDAADRDRLRSHLDRPQMTWEEMVATHNAAIPDGVPLG